MQDNDGRGAGTHHIEEGRVSGRDVKDSSWGGWWCYPPCSSAWRYFYRHSE